MFNKILVVCVGNICRSPTAERLLKNYQPALTVDSAGLGALVGKVMLFGHWDGEREIPDPYRKSREAFEAVYTLLDQSARQWAQALKAQQG